MTNSDERVADLEKEKARLAQEIAVKQKIYQDMEEIKQDRKKLASVESDIHPTRSKKIAKALGLAYQGLLAGERSAMTAYKASQQKHLRRHRKSGKKAKLSKKAQHYVSRIVAEEVEAGYPVKQAVAIAYSRARKAGYKVPVKRKLRDMS